MEITSAVSTTFLQRQKAGSNHGRIMDLQNSPRPTQTVHKYLVSHVSSFSREQPSELFSLNPKMPLTSYKQLSKTTSALSKFVSGAYQAPELLVQGLGSAVSNLLGIFTTAITGVAVGANAENIEGVFEPISNLTGTYTRAKARGASPVAAAVLTAGAYSQAVVATILKATVFAVYHIFNFAQMALDATLFVTAKATSVVVGGAVHAVVALLFNLAILAGVSVVKLYEAIKNNPGTTAMIAGVAALLGGLATAGYFIGINAAVIGAWFAGAGTAVWIGGLAAFCTNPIGLAVLAIALVLLVTIYVLKQHNKAQQAQIGALQTTANQLQDQIAKLQAMLNSQHVQSRPTIVDDDVNSAIDYPAPMRPSAVDDDSTL